MVTTLPRLTYMFQPTGSALGDTVRVRGADSSLVLQSIHGAGWRMRIQ